MNKIKWTDRKTNAEVLEKMGKEIFFRCNCAKEEKMDWSCDERREHAEGGYEGKN